MDTLNKNVTMWAGDTECLRIKLNSDFVFGENDFALFTITDSSGTKMMQERLKPDDENRILVQFQHSKTKDWNAGTYQYGVRCYFGVVNHPDGTITYNQVKTADVLHNFTILRTNGSVD